MTDEIDKWDEGCRYMGEQMYGAMRICIDEQGLEPAGVVRGSMIATALIVREYELEDVMHLISADLDRDFPPDDESD